MLNRKTTPVLRVFIEYPTAAMDESQARDRLVLKTHRNMSAAQKNVRFRMLVEEELF
jgi:hypothetical protein